MPSSHHSIATRRYQCRHILTGGRRCGSPSLRGEDFCYYHHTSRRPKPRVPHDPFLHPPNETEFTLPVPEDRTAISQSIGEIMNKLAANALDPRRAGLLLYALQIASANLPKAAPLGQVPDTVEEVTVDPVLGPLAPVAEVAEVDDGIRGRGVVQALVDRMEREAEEERQAKLDRELEQREASARRIAALFPGTIPTLQATAASPSPRSPRASKSTPKCRVRRTLRPSTPGEHTPGNTGNPSSTRNGGQVRYSLSHRQSRKACTPWISPTCLRSATNPSPTSPRAMRNAPWVRPLIA